MREIDREREREERERERMCVCVHVTFVVLQNKQGIQYTVTYWLR